MLGHPPPSPSAPATRLPLLRRTLAHPAATYISLSFSDLAPPSPPSLLDTFSPPASNPSRAITFLHHLRRTPAGHHHHPHHLPSAPSSPPPHHLPAAFPPHHQLQRRHAIPLSSSTPPKSTASLSSSSSSPRNSPPVLHLNPIATSIIISFLPPIFPPSRSRISILSLSLESLLSPEQHHPSSSHSHPHSKPHLTSAPFPPLLLPCCQHHSHLRPISSVTPPCRLFLSHLLSLHVSLSSLLSHFSLFLSLPQTSRNLLSLFSH